MYLLKTTRDALLAPLQSVAGIVEKRQTLPILSNVLIEKSGGQLTLLATDIEIQIRTSSVIDEEGTDVSVTVSARKLHDILRALPEATDVVLEVDENRMTVRANKSRFTLQMLPASDYPRMSAPTNNQTYLQISQRNFKQLLSQVSYAMAHQDIRYYLNGLLLVAEGNELRTVATDAHRLAFACSTLEGNAVEKTDVILPRKTVLELARQLTDSDDLLEIALSGTQAVFRFGSTEFITKLIDGKFPDYERVIPQEHPHTLKFDRTELLSALSRAAILTSEKFRGIRLMLGEGNLKITSINSEKEEAYEEIEVFYHDNPIDIGFNVTYLLEVLNHSTTDQILWHFKDNHSSALITQPDDNSFKYVVMPMKI